jgi:hypothetical protein
MSVAKYGENKMMQKNTSFVDEKAKRKLVYSPNLSLLRDKEEANSNTGESKNTVAKERSIPFFQKTKKEKRSYLRE